ncbi:MAG: S9 family peptidase [Balneolales bacterium]|nr:S9 family peptidase [Balneolales bacterium]
MPLTNRSTWLTLPVLLVMLCFAGCGTAAIPAAVESSDRIDESNLLTVEKMWELHRVGSPAISPNGEWIVAPVTHFTISDDKAHTDLWLFRADGSIERPLTRHGSSDSQPVFSPDGTRMAFVSRRDGDDAPQIYTLPLDGPGEAVRLTEVPTGVSAIKWVGTHLYFVSNIFPGKSWNEMEERLKADRASHNSAIAWNALPYSSFDRYLDEDREAHVFRIPANGGETQNLTLSTGLELPRSGQSTGSYDVSPDESLLAFVTDTNANDLDPKLDIYLVRPGSSEARNITPDNDAPDSNPLFSPDGTTIAYTSQRIKGFYADRSRLMTYSLGNSRTTEHFSSWDRSAGGLSWLPDGSGLVGSIDDAGTRRIYHFDLGAETPRAVTGNTDYPSLAISSTGVMVAQNHSFLHPPQLHMVDLETGNTTRIDTINDDKLKDVEMGTYESVTYEGANGAEIQMWVHYPPGFDSSKKYPLMFLIHGGPHNGMTNGFHFRWNAQTFASWGYVTAWHNFHGSSGFGQDFTDAINPDWITKPYEDTIRAAEWFMEKDWIDSDRMVAAGASYGGYLSSMLLGKDHPFNALVIHAPVYNMYSQMSADFAVHTTRFGDYWEDDGSHFNGQTIYEFISPHYYAANFRTPALIIHGLRDLRVPVGQSFELFRTLQSKGIESRLIYYPDENHWILKPNNSINWYHEVRNWVERFAEPGGR